MAAALLSLAALHAAHSQRAPRNGGTVIISVVDTSATPPVRPFYATAMWPKVPGNRSMYLSAAGRQVGAGRFRFDSLPADTVSVSVGCSTISMREAMRGAGRKGSLRVAMREDLVVDTTVVVDHRGCDPRPIRIETRVFSGFWTPGFESSAFVPCPGDDWTLPSDSLTATFQPYKAWARLDSAAQRSARRIEWPKDAPRDAWENPTYFVRWHGAMVGPGQYGHMGVSPFQLTVDSVIAVAKPDAAGACGARN